ncbi:uncharacterized protein LOC144617314 isoform X2 [Panthera onca]
MHQSEAVKFFVNKVEQCRGSIVTVISERVNQAPAGVRTGSPVEATVTTDCVGDHSVKHHGMNPAHRLCSRTIGHLASV